MKRFVVALLFSTAFAIPASAVDLSQQILTEDGKPVCQETVKDNEACPVDRIATLGRIIKIALYASFPDEQNLSGEEKYKRAEVAQSLVGVTDVKLKAEDIVLIKKVVGKLYGPFVVHAVWKMLEK